MKKKILIATGLNSINSAIQNFNNYEIVKTFNSKKELHSKYKQYKANILLVGEGLPGSTSLIKICLEIKKNFPDIRIVYLAGDINLKDENRINSLALLAVIGIYDIICKRKINTNMLKKILDKPKSKKDIEYILKASDEIMVERNKCSKVEFITSDRNKNESKSSKSNDIRENLYIVSSIKPGTGKSFLSANVATAIARYGVNTKDNKRPRVGLIEADLQNLSLGTLLQIEDDTKNLKTVMKKIGSLITEEGDFIGDPRKTEEVDRFIKDCFISYDKVKNLKALVGSQLLLDELKNITNYHYIYLIDAIIDYFDVLIVDSNSALTHVTTFPLLYMAKKCYYILNLDFNNVRNNIKYKEILEEMGILNKIKYVLNEDISNKRKNKYDGTLIEEIMFDSNLLEKSGFKLEAKIPVIPKTVFLNRLYKGVPIVLDRKKETEKIKYEILKIANQIYPIKNFSKIEENILKESQGKKRSFFK